MSLFSLGRTYPKSKSISISILNNKSPTYLNPSTCSYSAIDITLSDPSSYMDYTWKAHDLCGSDHYHHVVPLARISLTLSCHFSLSFIAFGRSTGLHPVSSHSCCMYVRAGRPAFARPHVGVHWGTSLMSSSLLLQQYPACLVRLTWIVFMMGGRWPYSWCLVTSP